jgi:hypothetical protein
VLCCEIWVTQLRIGNILLFSILTFSSPSGGGRASTITIWLLNVGPLSLALTRNVAPKRNSTRPLSASHSNIIICKCARKYEGRRAPFLIICLSSPLFAPLFSAANFFLLHLLLLRENLCIRRKEAPVVHTGPEPEPCSLFDSKAVGLSAGVKKKPVSEISRSALLGFAL